MKKILLNEYNIESIYRYSQNDYTILGLNILENVNHLTNNYKIIDEIYYHQIIGDYQYHLSDRLTQYDPVV